MAGYLSKLVPRGRWQVIWGRLNVFDWHVTPGNDIRGSLESRLSNRANRESRKNDDKRFYMASGM